MAMDTEYVLVDRLLSLRSDKPVYFQEWTDIGPACTSQLSKAEKFASVQAARQSRAYPFSLTSFEPIEANEDSVFEFLTDPRRPRP